MTDEVKIDPNTPEARIDAARNAHWQSMREIERTLYDIGYDAGFNAGWDACWRRFQVLFDQPKPDPGQSSPPLTPERPPEMLGTKEIVLQIVKQNPCIRGVEIADLAATKGVTNKKTVRTALHRLKLDGLIVADGGLWAAVDKESAAGTYG